MSHCQRTTYNVQRTAHECEQRQRQRQRHAMRCNAMRINASASASAPVPVPQCLWRARACDIPNEAEARAEGGSAQTVEVTFFSAASFFVISDRIESISSSPVSFFSFLASFFAVFSAVLAAPAPFFFLSFLPIIALHPITQLSIARPTNTARCVITTQPAWLVSTSRMTSQRKRKIPPQHCLDQQLILC